MIPSDQSLETVQPEDHFKLRVPIDAKISPDGKQVVFVMRFTDLKKDEDRMGLWLYNKETGETRQLTNGEGFDYSPRWSPDGSQIAFISSRKGKNQIYLMPMGGGDPYALTDLEQGISGGFSWSPDGSQIAFSTRPKPKQIDTSKPYRVTREVYRMNGMGYLDGTMNDLFLISMNGGEPRQITNDDCHNTNPVWSPDGKQILYSASFQPGSKRTHPDLRVLSLEGGQRDLLVNWNYVLAAKWIPDGKKVVFMGYPDTLPLGTQRKLWVIDSLGGEPECRTTGVDLDFGWGLQPDMPHGLGTTLLISEDGKFAYIQAANGGRVSEYRISLEGDIDCTPIISGKRTAIAYDLNGNDILFYSGDENNPGDFCLADTTGNNEVQITDLNKELREKRLQPKMECLNYASGDGVMVETYLLTPPLGQPPFPTIVCYHGGPMAGLGHIYYFDAQMLAGAGYAVFMVNYRGSSGYGDDFSRPIYGQVGKLELMDTLTGLDLAIEKGLCDPDRLGCFGISNGGFMTCWTVGQTNRFKAAVAENPVTNQLTEYSVSDFGLWYMEKEMGGKPHEKLQAYLDTSPVLHAHKCTTPTLLIQAELDYRCPAEQSEQFYGILKANSCIVEMLRLPGVAHSGSISGPPIIRRAQNEALLEWMQRYV